MRFCRFCGAPIPADSLFCPKCGKRLGRRPHPRLDRIAAQLRLRTPYPYFVLLLTGSLLWAVAVLRPRPFDYSPLRWSVRSDRTAEADKDGEYHQTFWLIVENTSATVARDIPVGLGARVEPGDRAAVAVQFQGATAPLPSGVSTPLILGDPIEPGLKRLYRIDGTVRAQPPFTVTYEFVDQSGKSLTRYSAAY